MANVLKVPDSGLRLMGPEEDRDTLPTQAFFLNLGDDVIESMIKSVSAGQEIRLQLGDEPTLEYGYDTHIITPPAESIHTEVYLTKPYESAKSAMRIPHTSSLFEKPSSIKENGKSRASHHVASEQKASSSSGLESDYEILQNSLAAEEAARGRTKMVDTAMSGKRGTTKLKGRTFSPNPSSIPGSPALRGIGSPSHTSAQSASQQSLEKAKRDRFPLVHELAVQDQTLDHLQSKFEGNKADFRTSLDKIADKMPSDLWSMRKNYWKELDVWSYDYDSDEERNKAIENAVKHFDKQRMSRGEPEWDRLNKPEDRGKGICLSKLQARIATKETAPPAPTSAPKIKVNGTDDGMDDRGNLTDSGGSSGRGGEKMARTGSNPLPAKSAQAKRLLGGGSKAKTAAPKPAPKAAPKQSPTKAGTGKVSKSADGRILSQEIIEDSDSSGDEAKSSASSKASKTTARPAPPTSSLNARPKPKPTQAPVPKARPAPKEAPKAAPVKRSREDEDSSSSSGTPLAKRLKGRPIAGPSRTSQAPSEAPRKTAPSYEKPKPAPKDVSPRKSSPLASSPPTNASDMEPERDSTPEQPRSPRPRPKQSYREAPTKRPRFSDEIMELTAKFKASYAKYERFHRQVSSESNPDPERVDRLVAWHNRLDAMKKRIQDAA